ncbi:translation initiation factor IF-2 [Brachionus plicatilis]|uniref:Translation initiation factor IF-2 n=1 Tax=Brachionus plicatilis TaxID=10195 RepID=A0A3M7T388_BRAPC|nr:translation initiation factor IF-2 [Brachionus plicatilis]
MQIKFPPNGGIPIGAPPYGDRPIGAPPYGDKPIGAPPYGDKPIGAPPYGDRPIGAPPYGEPYCWDGSTGTTGMQHFVLISFLNHSSHILNLLMQEILDFRRLLIDEWCPVH